MKAFLIVADSIKVDPSNTFHLLGVNAIFIEEIFSVHPYYGHVTIEREAFKTFFQHFLARPLTQPPMGPIRIVLKLVFGDEERYVFFSKEIGKKFDEVAWFLTEDARINGWKLRFDRRTVKVTHFGSDHTFINKVLGSSFSDLKTLVSPFSRLPTRSLPYKVGYDNFCRIMSYLPLHDLYKGIQAHSTIFHIFETKKFLLEIVREQCYILPKNYFTNDFELMKELSKEELKDALRIYGQKLSIANNMTISNNDGIHWIIRTTSNNIFPTYAHLNHDTLIHMSGTLLVKRGLYNVDVCYRPTSTERDGNRFELHLNCKKGSHFINTNCLVPYFDARTNDALTNEWTTKNLGQLEVLSERESIIITLSNSDNRTIKQDLDLDYISFTPLVEPYSFIEQVPWSV